ncbi:MAG: hypothetical protein NTV49_01595 [Kiritimatiellaeota bacterium]|nr:hypothetical protein [Kiritimatiellota bacterium]
MAVLQQPVVSGNVFADQIGDDLAPAGTFVATVIDIRDEFGVQRQKYQSTEIETVDLTTFLFGFRDAQGGEHRVSSRRMKISGNEKSTLFGFLKGLLGHAPQYGKDYMELRGAQCRLTVEHIQRRDGTGVFAGIAALSPVPTGFSPGGTSQGQVLGAAVAAPATLKPVVRPVGPVSGRPAAHSLGSGQARPGAPSPAPAGDPIPF